MPELDDIQIHTVWNVVLSVLGGIVLWSWKRIADKVDEKADRDEMEQKADKSEIVQLRMDLQQRWIAQDEMHRENRRRLDRILEGLAQIKSGEGERT